MGYHVDYRRIQHNKPKKLKCACGKDTFQPEGVCILCTSGIELIAKELGPAGPLPKALQGGGRPSILKECGICGEKFRARGNTKCCRKCRASSQRGRSTAWYNKTPENRRKKLKYMKEYHKRKKEVLNVKHEGN